MHIGFAFPVSTTGSEFIMEWIVPVSEKVRPSLQRGDASH
jgi:hypothetical protein